MWFTISPVQFKSICPSFTGWVIIAIIGTASFLHLQLTVWSPYPIGWLFFAGYLGLMAFRLRQFAARR